MITFARSTHISIPVYSRKWYLFGAFSIILFSTTFVCMHWGPARLLMSFEYAISSILAIINPGIGVSIFIFLILTRQWEFVDSRILGDMPQDFGALMVVSFIFHMILKKKKYIVWNKSCFYLMCYSILLFFSIIKTGDPIGGAKVFFSLFAKILLVFMIIINTVQSHRDLKFLKSGLILGILTRCAFSLLYTLQMSGNNPFSFERVGTRLKGYGALGDSNDIASIIMLGLPITLVTILKIRSFIWPKVLSFCILFINLYLIWYSRSRGAALAVLSTIGCHFWFSIKRKYIAVVLVGLCLLSLIPITSTFERDKSDLKGSTENRINYWVTGGRMALKNPLLGVGFQQYPKNYEKYALDLKGEWGERTAHSTWVLVLAESGIPSFIFYILFFITIFKYAWNIKKDHPEYLYALIGYGVAISFLSQAYYYYPYILSGLIIAANNVFREENKVDELAEGSIPA